jgi:SPASM domain peptide maturase of grasp-with-spasm system
MDIKVDETLKVHANCIAIRGFKRSIIYDLQKMAFYFIPNDMKAFIDSLEDGYKTIHEIIDNANQENKQIIIEYIDFIISNELGVILKANEAKLFPPLSKNWFYPSNISNAILDIGDWYIMFFDKVVKELDTIACFNVQIRIFSNKDENELKSLLFAFENKRINSIELIVKYNENLSLDKLDDIITHNPRIHNIQLHSCPPAICAEQIGNGRLYFYQDKLVSEGCCGNVAEKYFNVNTWQFTESLTFNSCLNKKVSIDSEGNIKNCPSMKKSFGNIKDSSLLEAIEKEGFKDLWEINKDKIHVCKDCEFRYMCTDCRAYIEEPNYIYSKPLKCGYNPYTTEWEEWSTHPMKQKAIEYYGMSNLIK